MSLAGLIKRVFPVLLLGFFSTSVVCAETTLSITSGRGEPFVNTEHNGFYDLIVKNMFQRINVDAKTVLLPSERSLINANAGINDGNIARIKGLEKKYKNLRMVPGKIIDFNFVVFTKNKNHKIKNWDDLEPYNVAFINGWKVFEKKVSRYKSLVKTRDSQQLFKLLKKDRIDIALYDQWSGVWWTRNNNSQKIHYLLPPIASYQLYLYLNKKHEKLVPQLSQALQSMKDDGTYQRIYDQTLNRLVKP